VQITRRKVRIPKPLRFKVSPTIGLDQRLNKIKSKLQLITAHTPLSIQPQRKQIIKYIISHNYNLPYPIITFPILPSLLYITTTAPNPAITAAATAAQPAIPPLPAAALRELVLALALALVAAVDLVVAVVVTSVAVALAAGSVVVELPLITMIGVPLVPGITMEELLCPIGVMVGRVPVDVCVDVRVRVENEVRVMSSEAVPELVCAVTVVMARRAVRRAVAIFVWFVCFIEVGGVSMGFLHG
jgi:hypothetical protein